MARVRLYASLTGCDEEHHDCAAGVPPASDAVAKTGSVTLCSKGTSQQGWSLAATIPFPQPFTAYNLCRIFQLSHTNSMQLSPEAQGYCQHILNYAARSYTRTLFFGYHYRFLAELLRADEAHLPKQYSDLEAYHLGHLSVYGPPCHGSEQYQRHSYKYSQLQDLVAAPPPSKGQGQVLFLNGHLPGSWICEVGAKYNIAPEFFRQHIHLWRSTDGPVLHAITRTPYATSNKGLLLRLNTQGNFGKNKLPVDSFSSLILQARRRLLPDDVEWMPRRLPAAPGCSYIRGHAYLSNLQFVIEQDVSITVESNGDGWTGERPVKP